ncbi:MAG: hypothetical protein OXE74_06915, partial [Cyanobacteria bacterium MAG CAR2_bin_4]|nr:hypothetical protein [Cyanobacteria bacterium MAG CAR2_bin_4]
MDWPDPNTHGDCRLDHGQREARADSLAGMPLILPERLVGDVERTGSGVLGLQQFPFTAGLSPLSTGTLYDKVWALHRVAELP